MKQAGVDSTLGWVCLVPCRHWSVRTLLLSFIRHWNSPHISCFQQKLTQFPSGKTLPSHCFCLGSALGPLWFQGDVGWRSCLARFVIVFGREATVVLFATKTSITPDSALSMLCSGWPCLGRPTSTWWDVWQHCAPEVCCS